MEIEWENEVRYGGDGSFVWKDIVGVYVIAQKDGEKYKAVYVGQGNVHERMTAHENWKKEPNSCLGEVMKNASESTKVKYAEIKNEEDRNNAEYTLWYYYEGHLNNLCNKQIPSGKSIFNINFPFAEISTY